MTSGDGSVGVALDGGTTIGVRVALGVGRGVALAVGVAISVPVALGVRLGVAAEMLLATDSDIPVSAGVGVVMMTPAAAAFDVRPDTGASVALDSDRTGADAVLDGGTGRVDKGLGATIEVGVDVGSAAASAGRVGLGITVTADEGKIFAMDRVLRVGVGVGSREFTTCTRNVPPHPANNKPTNNMSKIPRPLRFIATSLAVPARTPL